MQYLIRYVISIFFFLCFSASVPIPRLAGWFNPDDDITDDDIIAHIKYLASDDLGGRFPGTKGDSLAEDYVINEFKKYNLKPMGEDGYREHFDFVSEIKLGSKNSLALEIAERVINYQAGTDFTPLGLSSVGTAEGEL